MRYINSLISGLIFAPSRFLPRRLQNPMGRNFPWKSEKPKLTRENLLAHGFKQSEKDKDLFVAEHARLGDVGSGLGFQITALRPTVSQDMHSDTRHGLVEGKQVLVKSEVRDEKGRIVRKSLDKPDAICTVYVWVKSMCPPSRLYGRTVPARTG